MNDKKLAIDCNLEIEQFGRVIHITTPETDHLEINFSKFSTFRKLGLQNYNIDVSRNVQQLNTVLFRNQTVATIKIGDYHILRLGVKKI